ncbi:hypothetical protein C7H84_19055 [Burkholderia sp. Nafp2/4-1b]|uniref:hypothetical protein n=1 Tax=Burkholderia sp. Nafp2/4-1b TaxID=2116686 RepID=UPI000EF884E7|nr:hypothetical protein [Burkholderia sp. Nafp2/4-1b]RKU01816.1 hypothetical protein C7H84_19055 [Burkholderia sp. Nafp2/4-1b]
MDHTLKLRVMFDMIDRWTRPLKQVLHGNRGLAQSLKHTRGELAALSRQQKAVASFRDMRSNLASTTTKLAAAQEKVKALAGSLRTFGPPSQQMVSELARARAAASRLRAEHKRQTSAVDGLRGTLAQAGIDTQQLATHERTLRTNLAATTATMHAQMQQLEALSAREKRLAAARSKMHAVQGVAGGMALGGYAARASGSHLLGNLGQTLGEAKHLANERARITALGLGDTVSTTAERYVRAMKTMGVSTTDNLTLMRDALSIFADEHHAQMVMPTLAKMKFANEALFGAEDAHAAEEKFMNMLKVIELRGGTKDEATFRAEANRVQQVLSATGGRVGGDEWRNFIQTGGVAAKQMRPDAFYYQMEPLIQEMGGHAVGTGLMSAYNNVYQGKTTVKAARELVKLGLINADGIEYNKMGLVNHFKTGALKGSALLKASPLEWLEQVFLPQLAKRGITDEDRIKDTIATVFTNRTAANLMTTMVMQREQIHKNARLNAGAYGIDDAAQLASTQTQGKEADALAKVRDLKREIGERVAPLYNAALDQTRALTERLIGAIQAHPRAARAIVTVLAVLAALLVVLGSVAIALAGLLGPLAIVRFSLTVLGVKGGIVRGVFGALASLLRGSLGRALARSAQGIAWLARGFGMLAAWLGRNLLRGLAMVGRALLVLGRLALAHPLLALVTLLAMAAVYVWQHWDTLGPKFAALWQTIGAACEAALDAVRARWNALLARLLGRLRSVLDSFGSLGAQFAQMGVRLVDGFVDGIRSRLSAVKEAIRTVADSAVGWFRDKLQIRSPSRVFVALGQYVGQGAALGMAGQVRPIRRAALGLATAAVAGFGLPSFAKPAPIVQATVPIDQRPPIMAPSAASAASGAGVVSSTAPTTITVHIHPRPGDDPQAIARAVTAELDRRERAQRARASARLSD